MSKPFNKYFDHTLLRPDATEAEIRTLLGQAAEEDFAAVCVNGCFVRPAAEYLADRNVNVATVVGFPLGAMARDAKAEEARIALSDGADEIDMVMNISAAKDGRWDYILNEIHLLAQICHLKAPGKGSVFGTIAGEPFRPAFLKVILETCLLTDEEIVQACRNMAENRTGALIVILHKNSLQDVIESGDRIDAQVSSRLIENIFFKDSPLHDGAMIIGGGRIIAARCTLPITEQKIPAKYGMRHKSAVGISERSDADVIVISEQRGTISFVRDGEISPVAGMNELKLMLEPRKEQEKQ